MSIFRLAAASGNYTAWDLSYAKYNPPGDSAWDISTANEVKSYTLPGVSNPNPNGLFFKPDGTKMYVVYGVSTADDIREFDLSTPWDVETASYVQNFIPSQNISSPTYVMFKPDGTKMYVSGNGDLEEYNLSTPWDISTATYVQFENIIASYFREDGLKLYSAGAEYDLSVAWDISTVSLLQTFDVSAQISNPIAAFFKSDGTKMLLTDATSSENIFEYDLTTPWDTSTLSYVQSKTLGLAIRGIYHNDESLYLSEAGGSTQDFIKQFSVGGFDISAQEGTVNGLFFKPDGLKMYTVGQSTEVVEYDLSAAWDLSTASYLQEFDVIGQDPSPTDVFFKPDGLKMYVLAGSGDEVLEYGLSTPWDISTATYLRLVSISSQDSGPSGLFFKPDGTKMYIVGAQGNDVNEYDLSTAWLVTTATYNQNFSLASQDTSPRNLFFRSDGLKMYVAGELNDSIYEYDLSTAWDVSSASFLQSFDVAFQENQPRGLFFKPDGRNMYVTGPNTDAIYQYSFR